MVIEEGLMEMHTTFVRNKDGERWELVPPGGSIGDVESFEKLNYVEVYVDDIMHPVRGMSTQSTRNQIERNRPQGANAFSMDVRLSEAGITGKRGLTYYKVELREGFQVSRN